MHVNMIISASDAKFHVSFILYTSAAFKTYVRSEPYIPTRHKIAFWFLFFVGMAFNSIKIAMMAVTIAMVVDINMTTFHFPIAHGDSLRYFRFVRGMCRNERENVSVDLPDLCNSNSYFRSISGVFSLGHSKSMHLRYFTEKDSFLSLASSASLLIDEYAELKLSVILV